MRRRKNSIHPHHRLIESSIYDKERVDKFIVETARAMCDGTERTIDFISRTLLEKKLIFLQSITKGQDPIFLLQTSHHSTISLGKEKRWRSASEFEILPFSLILIPKSLKKPMSESTIVNRLKKVIESNSEFDSLGNFIKHVNTPKAKTTYTWKSNEDETLIKSLIPDYDKMNAEDFLIGQVFSSVCLTKNVKYNCEEICHAIMRSRPIAIISNQQVALLQLDWTLRYDQYQPHYQQQTQPVLVFCPMSSITEGSQIKTYVLTQIRHFLLKIYFNPADGWVWRLHYKHNELLFEYNGKNDEDTDQGTYYTNSEASTDEEEETMNKKRREDDDDDGLEEQNQQHDEEEDEEDEEDEDASSSDIVSLCENSQFRTTRYVNLARFDPVSREKIVSIFPNQMDIPIANPQFYQLWHTEHKTYATSIFSSLHPFSMDQELMDNAIRQDYETLRNELDDEENDQLGVKSKISISHWQQIPPNFNPAGCDNIAVLLYMALHLFSEKKTSYILDSALMELGLSRHVFWLYRIKYDKASGQQYLEFSPVNKSLHLSSLALDWIISPLIPPSDSRLYFEVEDKKGIPQLPLHILLKQKLQHWISESIKWTMGDPTEETSSDIVSSFTYGDRTGIYIKDREKLLQLLQGRQTWLDIMSTDFGITLKTTSSLKRNMNIALAQNALVVHPLDSKYALPTLRDIQKIGDCHWKNVWFSLVHEKLKYLDLEEDGKDFIKKCSYCCVKWITEYDDEIDTNEESTQWVTNQYLKALKAIENNGPPCSFPFRLIYQ